jgi:hypothetical protein
MRTPATAELHAPEFPPGLDWLGVAFLRMDKLAGRAAALVEFFDFARVNSLRTLPYLETWHERYAAAGLRVIGVHSPAYSFGRDRRTAARAIARLEIPYPVALDPDFAVWRLYGNRGWPARYLFDVDGRLRYVHYGEGDYEDAELAIQEALLELDPGLDLPPPLAPLRPEDRPGALLRPQTADVALPRERRRVDLAGEWRDGEDWIEATAAGASATVRYSAGAAFAVVSGAGVDEPGLRETDGTVVADAPGLRLHGFQFAPLPPGR